MYSIYRTLADAETLTVKMDDASVGVGMFKANKHYIRVSGAGSVVVNLYCGNHSTPFSSVTLSGASKIIEWGGVRAVQFVVSGGSVEVSVDGR